MVGAKWPCLTETAHGLHQALPHELPDLQGERQASLSSDRLDPAIIPLLWLVGLGYQIHWTKDSCTDLQYL